MNKLIRSREDSRFDEVGRLSIQYEAEGIRICGGPELLYPLQFLFLDGGRVIIEYIPYEKYLEEVKERRGDGSVSIEEFEKSYLISPRGSGKTSMD